jgi:adenylate cyclase class IV
MAREKEIKIKLTTLSHKDFIDRITSKGFKLINTIEQEDIYFDTIGWYLYENLAALRIRKTNSKFESFSFKKMFYLPNRADHYYIEEIETKFPIKDKTTFVSTLNKIQIKAKTLPSSGYDLVKFLRAAGYLDEQHMPKTRQVYKNGSNEIVIDEVDKVGTIIELECQDDEPLELARTILKGKEWVRSTEGTSYMWLKKVKGLNSHIANVKRFQDNPSWNVWPGERAMYSSL